MSLGRPTVRRAMMRELRAARLEAGLTRAQLAGRLKVSVPRIRAMEEGKRRVGVGELVRIARALGIDPVILLARMLG